MKIELQKIGIMALAILLCGGMAIAAPARQATLSKMSGEVLVRQNQQDWQPAAPGMVLHAGDEIKTSKGATAEVIFDNGEVGSVKVAPKSVFKIGTMDVNGATGDKATLLELAIGKVMVHAEKLHGASKFEVETPTATTGVRGTLFEVTVE